MGFMYESRVSHHSRKPQTPSYHRCHFLKKIRLPLVKAGFLSSPGTWTTVMVDRPTPLSSHPPSRPPSRRRSSKRSYTASSPFPMCRTPRPCTSQSPPGSVAASRPTARGTQVDPSLPPSLIPLPHPPLTYTLPPFPCSSVVATRVVEDSFCYGLFTAMTGAATSYLALLMGKPSQPSFPPSPPPYLSSFLPPFLVLAASLTHSLPSLPAPSLPPS